jgi:pyridoxine kinase
MSDSVRPPGIRPEAARIAVEVDDTLNLELTAAKARLIAFGSQLLHGSVGLNAARRVYDLRGLRTITVPTILLSVMPHYASSHHLQTPAAWLADALTDLTEADALNGLELATVGYIATPAQIAPIAEWCESLRASSSIPVVLDPTLGDVGLGFYTDPAVADAMRETLLPVATGLTPNVFELAQLTATPVADLNSYAAIEDAARSLMTPNTQWIVVTGVDLPTPETQGNTRQISEVILTPTGTRRFHREAIDTTAKGLGDTFTAALNAALLDNADIGTAVNAAAVEVHTQIRLRSQTLSPPTVPTAGR